MTIEAKLADRPALAANQINAIASAVGARTYLEIGLWKGETFFEVAIADKTGVDPAPRFDVEAAREGGTVIFEMTSDVYFSQADPNKPMDVIFLDGLHSFDQTLRDFCASQALAHSHTVWIIDDIVPWDIYSALPDQKMAREYRKALTGEDGSAWHGDVYKVPFAIHDLFPQFAMRATDRRNQRLIAWQAPRETFAPRFSGIGAIAQLGYHDMLDHQDVLRMAPVRDIIAELARDLGTS